MIKIISVEVSKEIELVLGSAVEIVVFLTQDKPFSIKITIYNPTRSVIVSAITMSRVNSKVYNYIYQSSSSELEGLYIVSVEVSDGTNTSVKQIEFELNKQLQDI